MVYILYRNCACVAEMKLYWYSHYKLYSFCIALCEFHRNEAALIFPVHNLYRYTIVLTVLKVPKFCQEIVLVFSFTILTIDYVLEIPVQFWYGKIYNYIDDTESVQFMYKNFRTKYWAISMYNTVFVLLGMNKDIKVDFKFAKIFMSTKYFAKLPLFEKNFLQNAKKK